MPKSAKMDSLIDDLCMQAYDDGCEVLVVWTSGGITPEYVLGGCGGHLRALLKRTTAVVERLTKLADLAAASRKEEDHA